MDWASLELIILYVVLIVITVYCWCRIWGKAGFPAWYGLSVIIPILNLIAFLYLTFAEWPNAPLTIGRGRMWGGVIR